MNLAHNFIIFFDFFIFLYFAQSDNSSLDGFNDEIEDLHDENQRIKEEAELETTEMVKSSVYASLEEDQEGHLSPEELKERMDGIVEVLGDFKNRREKNKSRSDYLDALVAYCADYYGYLRELVELFFSIFSPDEAIEFLEANEQPRPVVIRTNTLKSRRKDLSAKLSKRGVSLEPLAEWTKVFLEEVG